MKKLFLILIAQMALMVTQMYAQGQTGGYGVEFWRDSNGVLVPIQPGKVIGGTFIFSPGTTQRMQTVETDTIRKYSTAGTLNIINTSPYLITHDTGVSAQAWIAWWVQSDSTVGYFEWVAQKVAVGPGDSTVDYYLRRVYDVDRTTYQGTSYLDPIHFSQNTRTLHFLGNNTTGLPWGTVNINGGDLTMSNGTDIIFSNLVKINAGVGGSERLKVKPISTGSSYIELVPKTTGGAGVFIHVTDRDNDLTNYGAYELRANDTTGFIFKSSSAGSVTVDDAYTFNNTGTNKVGTSPVYVGSLFTNATQRLDASGNLSNIGTINATGEIHSSLMGVPALTIGNVDLGGDSDNRAIAYISSSSGLSILSMGQSSTAYGQNVWRYNATESSAYWDFKSTKGISLNVNGGTSIPTSASDLAIGATTITTTASIISGPITSTGLSTFGTNIATATIGAGDSVQVTVTGLTTSGVANVSYYGKKALTDIPTGWAIYSANTLSLYGTAGSVVSYWIGKK